MKLFSAGLGLLFCTTLATFNATNVCAQTKKITAVTPDAASVKKEFVRSWNAYKQYAWGHDVLLPITKGHSDWYEQSLQISPIDAYSTMRVMGLDKQAAEVARYVTDSVSFEKDFFVKTFEVNIRILGGLLSMYSYTNDPKILARTQDFGDRLLKAFNSPTGIPYYWVNLKTGEAKGEDVNVAEAASYTFEMGILSYYTKDPKYYQAAKKATLAVYERRSPLGLIGERINVNTGKWTNTSAFIGAGGDSYYEYLLKTAILLGDPEIRNIWKESIVAINKYVADESDTSLWYGHTDMYTGKQTSSSVTLYDAFFPALLSLDAQVPRAEKLQHTWNKLWNKYGLEPMIYDYKTGMPTDPVYDLNPEIIESAYYLYHYTKKKEYLAMGHQYYKDMLQYCRTPIAFSSIGDVRTKVQNNELPTFFFAETMKYYYLLLGGKHTLNPDLYVFNTEAHPFRKADFTPLEAAKRLGFSLNK